MKKILLIVAYSLIVLYVSAQSTLPERYVPYIVDAIYTSDDHVRTSGKGESLTYRMKTDTVPQLLVVQYSGENKPGKGRISYLIYLSMVPSCILKGSIVTGTDYLKWYIPFRRKH